MYPIKSFGLPLIEIGIATVFCVFMDNAIVRLVDGGFICFSDAC